MNNSTRKRQKKNLIYKIIFAVLSCLVVLFSGFFTALAISGDFRHMVFTALEGRGDTESIPASAAVLDKDFENTSVSETDIAGIIRPTALDGQGYEITANGNSAKNYFLTYQKDDSPITFELAHGKPQSKIDTQNTTLELVQVNNNPAYLALGDGYGLIEILFPGEITCTLSGSLSREELISLAESISV